MEPLGYESPNESVPSRRWLPTWVKVTGGTLMVPLFVGIVVVPLIVLLQYLFIKLMMFVAPML